MKSRPKLVGLITAACAAALVACSDSESPAANDNSDISSQLDDASNQIQSELRDAGVEVGDGGGLTIRDDEHTVQLRGEYQGEINGTPFDVPESQVQCVKNSDGTVLSASSMAHNDHNSAAVDVNIATDGSVSSVSMLNDESQGLQYTNSDSVGHADATVENSTYSITGSGLYTDGTNSNDESLEPVPFKIEVKCEA